MKRPHPCETEHAAQECSIVVYKLVWVIDGPRTSMSMAAGCSATYFCDQVTVPPIPQSRLFAYRTLEIAGQEFARLKEINQRDPRGSSTFPVEIWIAKTTGEVVGPSRIPTPMAYYSSLLRHARYGTGLRGCYEFFWQNVSYCLKHCIGKCAGQRLDPAITVCCRDLMLLERLTILEGERGCQ